MGLKAGDGRWVLQLVTYTTGQAMESAATKVPAAAPSTTNANVPPGTYVKALAAWKEFMQQSGSIDLRNMSDATKAQALTALEQLPATLRRVTTLLKGTDLEVPEATVGRACDNIVRLHDALKQRGVDGVKATLQELNGSPNAAADSAALMALNLKLRARVDAVTIAAKPHPPSFAPPIEVTLAWDGSKATIPGWVVMPPWLRDTEAYKHWQEVHDIETLQTTDDQGFSYEVVFDGAVEEKDGTIREIISAVRRYRPDGTLAATAQFFATGNADVWNEIDATGKRRVVEVARDSLGRLRVQLFNPDGGYRLWEVEKGKVSGELLHSPIDEAIRITHHAPQPPVTRRASTRPTAQKK